MFRTGLLTADFLVASQSRQTGLWVYKETVQNLGVITSHFDTDDVPTALRWHDPC